jgi:hypothetical protein
MLTETKSSLVQKGAFFKLLFVFKVRRRGPVKDRGLQVCQAQYLGVSRPDARRGVVTWEGGLTFHTR